MGGVGFGQRLFAILFRGRKNLRKSATSKWEIAADLQPAG